MIIIIPDFRIDVFSMLLSWTLSQPRIRKKGFIYAYNDYMLVYIFYHAVVHQKQSPLFNTIRESIYEIKLRKVYT